MVKKAMTPIASTKDSLLMHARREFWSRGYSNVGLRDIAKKAGVDVALVSRYFGSKLGLFEATLETAFTFDSLPEAGEDALVDAVIGIFTHAPRGAEPSVVQMILMNAHDADVGALVRTRHQATLQRYLDELIGDKSRAALFMAVVLGISVAEKTLHLDGIAPPSSADYTAQLRHMLQAALAYGR